MSSDPFLIDAGTDGGIVASHPPSPPLELLVGPATSSEFNTARMRLIPVACWRVEKVRFDFDSSFIRPEIATELDHLRILRDKHKRPSGKGTLFPPLAVFGHADPVGNDDYNKLLSGRRAMAVFAVLIVHTEPNRSVTLWRQIASAERWGAGQRRVMQAETELPDGTTDSALFKAYMQKLCPPDLVLSSKDFLAQGGDDGGKGDVQGCSEFNPLLVFSSERQAEFDRAKQQNDRARLDARDTANAPNRRVMVLLFRPGSQVVPSRWPCPRANEGVAACRARFWSDGEKRRGTHAAGRDRKFEDSKDTFACRFYQRLVDESPCERIVPFMRIRLFDSLGNVLPKAPFVVKAGAVESKKRIADDNGEIALRDIGVPVLTVKWSRPPEMRKEEKPPAELEVIGLDGVNRMKKALPFPPEDFEFERDVVVTINRDTVETAPTRAQADMSEQDARARLSNMGYLVGDQFSDLIRAFERDCDLPETGVLSKAVVDKLKEFHDVKVASPGFSDDDVAATVTGPSGPPSA